jgi:hypothetical protein
MKVRRNRKRHVIRGRNRCQSASVNELSAQAPAKGGSMSRSAFLGSGDVSRPTSKELNAAASWDRIKTQWQFGDWPSLIAIRREQIQHHARKGDVALLVGVAHQQAGDLATAREFIELAESWGSRRDDLLRVLIAGTYNSLGRAALIRDRGSEAACFFEKAVRIGSPSSDHRLLTRARILEQAGQLRASSNKSRTAWTVDETILDRSRFLIHGTEKLHAARGKRQSTLPPGAVSDLSVEPNHNARDSLAVIECAEYPLGEAWAGNTINTVIFRHHGIFTRGKIQYTAFFVDAQRVRVVRRDLATGKLETHDIPGKYNLIDAHNSISLGQDRLGHLHICYDQHASQLRYRRSLHPNDIQSWTEELSMSGFHEAQVTYPTFLLPRRNHPLTLLFRDGSADKGTARLKTYDEVTQIWTDHPHPILSGSDQKPWTSNAYWNHPATGDDGSLHLSFVWRTHFLGDERRVNNIDIGYACSRDNGLTWQTSKGWPYRLPITQVNVETVHPVSPGSNLINQTSMMLDSQNRAHIVFYADDADGIPQYQHLWFDGKVWKHQIVSNRTKGFSLRGSGTLQIPISRPEIVIDRCDNIYIITRGDHTQNRLAVTFLPATNYAYDPSNTQILAKEVVGFAEPIIDRVRWKQDNILTLLLQHNEQPNHDKGHSAMERPIRLVDIQFKPTE